jgi:D-sedoheptulose 7-phosphate isomerase
MDFKNKTKEYYKRLNDALQHLNYDEINDAMNAILNHYKDGTTIYVFGNGGSAATASHMMIDFNKGAGSLVKKQFDFVCLNENIPTLTAIANDISYDDIFSYQLTHRLKKQDLVIAISGSGNSKNVVKAAEYTKKVGADLLGITGFDGGKLKKLSKYNMHVNVNDMQIVEDVHMTFDHMMMQIFMNYLKETEK